MSNSENDRPGSLDSAVSTLGEQTKKYEIATYYTHGDDERSRQMVAGSYKDVFVVKGKFASSTVYGAFIFFFNMPYCSLTSAFSVISQSFYVNDIKTNIEWRQFEKEVDNLRTSGDHDDVLSANLNDEFVNFFNMKVGGEQKAADLKKLLEKNDPIALNLLLQKFVQNRLGFQGVNITADYEQITSIDMELLSMCSRKIDPLDLKKQQQDEAKKNEPQIEVLDDEDSPLSGKEIKLVLRGSLILSPIKGKDIATLEVRDRIRISIVDTNQKAIKVAKAFNAYEDGEMKPIIGRIVSVRKRQPQGYMIFAIIAKGIYVKIEEEEENIKVSLDPASLLQSTSEESGSKKNVIIITALLIFLAILVTIIIAFIK